VYHIRHSPALPKNRVDGSFYPIVRLVTGLVVAIWLVTIPSTLAAQTESASPPKSEPSAGSGDPEERSSPRGLSKTGVALWMFQADNLGDDRAAEFRSALDEALSEANRRHLMTSDAFESYLEERSASVPSCLKGLERCISPSSLVFRQLELTALVRVEVQSNGESLTASYELVDHRGDIVQQAEVDASAPRELAFTLAGELFDATGTVTIESTPSGAAVRIDDRIVGTTPLETRLPVGKHTYTLQHPDHSNRGGTFELASGASETVAQTLEKRPGTILIRNAPEGASVHVDDEKIGPVGERLEVEPGSYQLEVRADGYEAYRGSVEITSGELYQRSIPLERSNPLLNDVNPDAIAVNNYIARLTFDQSIHGTTFRDARGSAGDTAYEFQGFTNDAGALPPGEPVRRTLAPNGLRLDLSYFTRHLGVIFLSLSYTGANIDRQAVVETASNETFLARATGLHRLQLRPLQVSYRHFFGNFVPSVELGTGIAFQWIDIGETADTPQMTLNQTEAFWNLGVTGQYFFDANWFGLVRYSAQDYFNRGKGLEHIISIGVGAAYPNLFGFEPEPPEQL
jgi:hypothetical protein